MERRHEKSDKIPAVRLTYRSKGKNITKRIFGYGPWYEKKAGKRYLHKGVSGDFRGGLIRKCGRASLIVPQELVEPVKEAIIRNGGEVKETTSVYMNRTQGEEMVDQYYLNFLRILDGLLKSAYETRKKEEFDLTLKRAVSLTRKLESLIREASRYAEETPTPRTLHQIFDGLQLMSNEDFEAAKIKARFLEKSVQKEYKIRLRRS